MKLEVIDEQLSEVSCGEVGVNRNEMHPGGEGGHNNEYRTARSTTEGSRQCQREPFASGLGVLEAVEEYQGVFALRRTSLEPTNQCTR